ncbi:MAG: hypothetical protein A2Y54_06580 [Chloroflexi bacterium RBG_16_51_16]|nr:MAG: hypothetical protein A2Y54_06580 [Chloroflexi bacterium RBG_16_51_16]
MGDLIMQPSNLKVSPKYSESKEMYLKALVELDVFVSPTVSRLANRLGVTQVSANEMVRRLTDQGLMIHTPYKGVNLTKKGRQLGNNVLRRQRLWECFLYDYLKVEWSRLYELTCNLEHNTPPEVTESLAIYLNNPAQCPHGQPIPTVDGECKSLKGIPLNQLGIGESASILSVTESPLEVVEHFSQQGLLPGKHITLVNTTPLQGPLTLQVGQAHIALGLQMAEQILVKRD